MSVALDELIAYWRGELPEAREAEVEELLFEDEVTARRLDAIVRLHEGVRALVAAGRLQSGLTVDAVEALEAAGLGVRTYRIDVGETVPCTIALEDLVVVRLRGDFAEAGRVDVTVEGTLEGMPPLSEQLEDVPVDRRSGELVLVFPGDRIRALPRSRVRYTVSSGERHIGEYGMDHTPPS